ncbi:MAG: hypothetical protein DMD63_06975 [Gemmatimonadetes bacterium]|nr:MAG: hypothetical protein DMD63_06975 [Gemmatimonadota bacterium]
MFWAETGQEQARNALRQAVHRLRHEVGTDVIESRGAEELSVNSKVLWSDVAAFDDALAAGKIADALSHYRGNLLPGFFLSDAPGFEQWLETERGRLRERAASAAWDLSRAESASGQLSMASHWARWAYALNPDDEADLRKLIDVLVRAGDHSSAVRAYEEFAERVSREYEIEPSSATRKLVEPLRAAPGGSTRPQTLVRQTATPFAPYTPYTAAPPPNDVESVEPAAAVLASGKRNWRRLAITGTAAVSILTVLALVGWRYVHNAADRVPLFHSRQRGTVVPARRNGRSSVSQARWCGWTPQHRSAHGDLIGAHERLVAERTAICGRRYFPPARCRSVRHRRCGGAGRTRQRQWRSLRRSPLLSASRQDQCRG